MNEGLSWLESIIVRRNLRGRSSINSEEVQDHTGDYIDSSPYTDSLRQGEDYYSTRGTLSDSGRSFFTFNPFDDEDAELLLSDLPPLPHSHSNSPLSPEVISQQQQLIDILTLNIDPTLYPELPVSPREAIFEGKYVTLQVRLARQCAREAEFIVCLSWFEPSRPGISTARNEV